LGGRFHRIEVLGALVSVLTTWLVTGILLWEAIDRIRHPVEVDGRRESSHYDRNMAEDEGYREPGY
jgi:hypothetical protein